MISTNKILPRLISLMCYEYHRQLQFWQLIPYPFLLGSQTQVNLDIPIEIMKGIQVRWPRRPWNRASPSSPAIRKYSIEIVADIHKADVRRYTVMFNPHPPTNSQGYVLQQLRTTFCKNLKYRCPFRLSYFSLQELHNVNLHVNKQHSTCKLYIRGGFRKFLQVCATTNFRVLKWLLLIRLQFWKYHKFDKNQPNFSEWLEFHVAFLLQRE